jgi:Fe-S cluster assembly iron-binding protein IscA
MTREVYEHAATGIRRERCGFEHTTHHLQGGGTAKRSTKEKALVLTLTENASTVVKTLVDQTGGAEEGGLRISQDAPDSPALHVIPSEAPQPGDQVLEEDGARVFLEEIAADTLEDKILDAQVDDQGGVQFTIAPQA